ncbi:MAG TPA: phosphatidate cytidylyltransferase [Candidatus Angelobacter sp.]
MKRVLTAVVLVPLVLLVVFKAPLWVFAVVVAVIAILAIHEYLNIARGYGIEPLRWPTYVLSLFLIVRSFAYADNSFLAGNFLWLTEFFQGWSIFLMVSLIFGIPLVFRHEMRMALAASGISAFGLFYIAAPMATLVLFRRSPYEAVFLVFILLSVWAGDTAAYYVGRSIGRHKLAPIVSPKKTWEGAIASVMASVAVALIVFHFDGPIRGMFTQQKLSFYTPVGASANLPVIHLVILGIVANIAAQLGDLFESAMKRGAQIKDSGSLLPGHGGILDRIDALLFAIPVVWYYASFQAYFFESQ